MRISDTAYAALEAVVGAENISAKEFVLAGNRVKTPEIPFEYHSADAIIMPRSTEEVAEIIKICNQYGIIFVPTISGASVDAFANREGSILINLCRMNRILEINETDRYALIEPGVRHVQLYPELRKRGWSYTAASVGPGGSVVSNFTSTSGDHHTQHANSRANRYLLGVEMVLPNGEIIHTGSLHAGSGWFCPDGPGPGLRGIVKGYCGSHGQMGIITKAAIAIDPCKGPAEFISEGISPHFRTRFESKCSKVYVYNYTDIRNVCEAMLRLGEAEIGSTVQKYFYVPLTLLMTDSANEFWQKWESGYREAMSMPLIVHLAPRSERELAYEERILEDIVAETGGKRLPCELESWWEDNMDFFMIVGRLQSVLRLGGGWMPVKLASDSVTHMGEIGASLGEYFSDYMGDGKLLYAPENYQIIPMEYGHFAHIEVMIMWDRYDQRSGKALAEFRARSRKEDIERHFHGETPGCLNATMEEIGPLWSDCNVWMRKIKEQFDPNNVANPML